MPIIFLGTLGLIAYKSWNNRGVPIDSVPDPTGMPEWSYTDLPDFGVTDKIDEFSDKIYGLILLYIVLNTKPWK